MSRPDPADTPLLQAEALAIGYPDRAIGGGIALSLHCGRVLALLGPNGGGKTTLMRTLLGLLPPRAGRLLLAGRPIGEYPDRERARRLAFVPQQQGDASSMRVADLVMTGRSAHLGLFAAPTVHDDQVVTAVLDRLGIDGLASRPTAALSGGERQLASIARALAQQADGILLDEPTASLDLGNQARVMGEIRRLAHTGLAVAFSTHDPNQALQHADEVLLLRDGQAMACGPTSTVLNAASLSALYRIPIRALHAPDGRIAAFLPGRD